MHRPSSAVNPSVLSTLLPILHGAEAGAASQVSDDHAPVGDLRRNLRQDRGDVLVGQAVEAVALDTGTRRSSRGSGTSSATAGWPR